MVGGGEGGERERWMECSHESYVIYIHTNSQSWHSSHYRQYYRSSTYYFFKRRVMMIDHKRLIMKKNQSGKLVK